MCKRYLHDLSIVYSANFDTANGTTRLAATNSSNYLVQYYYFGNIP